MDFRIHFTATLPEYLKSKEKESHPITRIALAILCIIFPPLYFLDWFKNELHLLVGRCLILKKKGPYTEMGLSYYREAGAIPISLTTPDGAVLDGQYWPSSTYHRNPKTVIMFNGNGENYENKIFKWKFTFENYKAYIPYHNIHDFHDAGHDLVVFNYRGIADSTGNVSCRGLKLDAETVYQFVHDYLDVPDEKIVLFGHSFGGAVATHLAKHHPVKLFNIRSFSSLKSIARHYATIIGAFILDWLKWAFDVVSDWKGVKGQKWIVYHNRDKIIPLKTSLFKAIGDPDAIQMKDNKDYIDEFCKSVPLSKREAFKRALLKQYKGDDAHNRALSKEEMAVILKLIDN